jgi:hypothetical protein
VDDTNVTEGDAVPPKRTDAPDWNPTPVMVTGVPPVTFPNAGLTDETTKVGA